MMNNYEILKVASYYYKGNSIDILI